MLQDTAQQQQQDAPGRCSASEQPEALARAIPKSKLSTNSSACSNPSQLTPAQQQALSAIDARLHLLGDYAVEAFKCQLWEPSRAVQDLEPGQFPCRTLLLLRSVLGMFTSTLAMLAPAACIYRACCFFAARSSMFPVSLQHCMHIIMCCYQCCCLKACLAKRVTQARLCMCPTHQHAAWFDWTHGMPATVKALTVSAA